MDNAQKIENARAWVRFILPLIILAIYIYLLLANHPAVALFSQWATPVLAAYLSADGGVKIVMQVKASEGGTNGVSDRSKTEQGY